MVILFPKYFVLPAYPVPFGFITMPLIFVLLTYMHFYFCLKCLFLGKDIESVKNISKKLYICSALSLVMIIAFGILLTVKSNLWFG